MTLRVAMLMVGAELTGIVRRFLDEDVEQLRAHGDPTEAEVAAYRELRSDFYREHIERELASPSTSEDVDTRGRAH